jgi:cyanophycin synthetase
MIRRLGSSPLQLDDEALGLLRQNGLEASYVPAAGEYVRLRRRDNINAGGTNEDVDLGAVHPDNLRLAVDAATLLRLDFAGVDLIMDDISISWFDAGALICEINAMPQMRATSDPAIYERLLAEFMPGEVRVPARLFVCPGDDAARRAALHRALGLDQYNGVADRSGLWVDGARATARFDEGLSAARALLMRKDVRGAVCLMTPKEILGLGLPVNRWSSVVFAASEEFSAQERALVSQVRVLLRDSVADAGAPANPTVEAD